MFLEISADKKILFWSAVSVRCLIWVWNQMLGRPVDGGTYIRMRVFLGVVTVWFLVVCLEYQDAPRTVPGYLQTCGFRKYSSNVDWAVIIQLCPTELPGIFRQSAFFLLWHLSDTVFVNSRNGCVSRLAVPRVFFLTFSSSCCQFYLLPES